MMNCHIFILGVEKFSPLHSSSVAAPKRPTTAGRRPENTDCTIFVFIYFMNILLMRIMRISDGRTRAKVETALPRTDIHMLKPSLRAAT